MKEFIVKYNDDNDYRLLSMKDIKDLLKKEYKEYILENAKDLEKSTIECDLDELLMIENCTNLATLTRMLNSFGYDMYCLHDARELLEVISNYLYYETQETDIFNRLQQVENDIACIMNGLKKD